MSPQSGRRGDGDEQKAGTGSLPEVPHRWCRLENSFVNQGIMLKTAKVKNTMNFALILIASSPGQQLVQVDSLRWFNFLFQAKSDLSSVVGRELDILGTSKTQALIDDISDECLGAGHYLCVISWGTPYARGFPRTLAGRNACWLQQALVSLHIGTVCTNKYSLSICRIGMRSRDRESPAVWHPQGIAQLVFVLLKHLKPISMRRPLCYVLCKQQGRKAAFAPRSFQPRVR